MPAITADVPSMVFTEQIVERADDAEHGAEQADERRVVAERAEEREAALHLEALDLRRAGDDLLERRGAQRQAVEAAQRHLGHVRPARGEQEPRAVDARPCRASRRASATALEVLARLVEVQDALEGDGDGDDAQAIRR